MVIQQTDRRHRLPTLVALSVTCVALAVVPARGQAGARQSSTRASADLPTGATPPPGYVIGADDLLSVRFWGEDRMSADVVVRSDGKISLPLLNDVEAAGLTPEQLGESLEKAALKYVTEPDATVIVREIRSRKVYVIGPGIARSGVVLLNSEKNVLQVLAESGGLLEFAHKDDIVIIRTTGGKEHRFRFDFDEVVRGKNPGQNITLHPGDTIVVN
jgi:polysaccharide export outer membrane protein